ALPFGRGMTYANSIGRAADAVIGGWQISGTMDWASGLPWTPGLSGSVCNLENDVNMCRPNRGSGSFHYGAGSFVHNNTGHFVQFFNPLIDASGNSLLANGGNTGGFADPGINRVGNAGYNSLRGPRYFGADASLAKNFTLTERLK